MDLRCRISRRMQSTRPQGTSGDAPGWCVGCPCVARQHSKKPCATQWLFAACGEVWRGGGPCVGFQQLLRALGALLPRCWIAHAAAAQEIKVRPAKVE